MQHDQIGGPGYGGPGPHRRVRSIQVAVTSTRDPIGQCRHDAAYVNAAATSSAIWSGPPRMFFASSLRSSRRTHRYAVAGPGPRCGDAEQPRPFSPARILPRVGQRRGTPRRRPPPLVGSDPPGRVRVQVVDRSSERSVGRSRVLAWHLRRTPSIGTCRDGAGGLQLCRRKFCGGLVRRGRRREGSG